MWSIWSNRLSHTVFEILSLKRCFGHDLGLLGSRNVISHVTIGYGYVLVVNLNQPSSCTVFAILSSKILRSQPWPFGFTWRIRSHDLGLAMCGFQLVVNMNRPRISHGCWNTELQRFWSHYFDPLGSRDVVSHVTVGLLIICGFLQVVLWNHHSISHRCWDIMCQTLSQAYSYWKCIVPHFCVLGAKLGVTAFCNFVLVAAP